jgi:hypothetical protein
LIEKVRNVVLSNIPDDVGIHREAACQPQAPVSRVPSLIVFVYQEDEKARIVNVAE